MTAELVPYVAPLHLSALVLLALLVTGLSHRSLTGAGWFAAFTGAVALWTVAYAFEITLAGREAKLLAARVQYVGIALAPAAWLCFSAEYVGLSWWSRRAQALLLAFPAVTVLLTWTNGLHGLVWRSAEVASGGAFTVLAFDRGPWFWAVVAFSYLCLLGAAGLYARAVLVRPRPFRAQAVLLLLGGLAPWAGNVLYLTGVGGGLDLTVFGFAVSGVLAAWAILRWRLLTVGPIARDTIVEGMAQPVAVLDTELRVVDVNPAMTELLGREAPALLGRPAPEALGAFLPGRDPGAAVQETVPDPRSERVFDCRVEPLRDARERLRGWTLVLHDVTRREAEAAALEEARRTAEETAEAQRAFLANMNHELRTPLNGILGMLQLLEDGALGPQERRWVAMASESAGKLQALVERVLSFGALEAGEVELQRRPFLLRAVAADVVEAVRDEAEARDTRVRMEAEPGLPLRVVGDAPALTRALACLLSNAVKFTHHGEVTLRLSAAGEADGATPVRFEVEDTGVGIPEHRLEAIFEDFVQADGSLTRGHEGAGLGLSIARGLVDAMGGELRVSSRVGRGSRFWFVLPLETPDDRAADPPREARA